jgi:CubicO group peptidase (beta-lactamase class C family)
MEIDDQFQLASVSKQFTAMAVMMLAERNVLDYDDLLVTHIPEFPYPTWTVRHLLNHTAGMPNYMYLMERYWKPDDLPDNEDVLRMMVKYKPGCTSLPGGVSITATRVRNAGAAGGTSERQGIRTVSR